MMQSGDDPGRSGLLDVIKRNRIARPKPPPSLLHVLVFLMVLMPEISSEMRLGLCTGNFNRKLGSGSILAEKWVCGFKQYGLPPGHGVRKFGVEASFAVKVELVAVQTILAGQIYLRPGNLELQLRKGNNTILQVEHTTPD